MLEIIFANAADAIVLACWVLLLWVAIRSMRPKKERPFLITTDLSHFEEKN